MTVRELKNFLEHFNDAADVMLVVQIGEKRCMVDDLITFAPSDGKSFSTTNGIYFYGDSCDFLEDNDVEE